MAIRQSFVIFDRGFRGSGRFGGRGTGIHRGSVSGSNVRDSFEAFRQSAQGRPILRYFGLRGTFVGDVRTYSVGTTRREL